MKYRICVGLYIALILLNVYDVYSTNTLLNSGMCYEANPLVLFFMEKMGTLTGMIVLKGVLLLWVGALLLRANTNRRQNVIMVGFIICTVCYTASMYFLNYQAMLVLARG